MKPYRHQRGITLVEALIGFLLLSLGLLGALRLQSWLRLNGDIARQRTEAVRMAQQDMEQVRTFANAAAFQGITNQRNGASNSPTAFTLTRTVATDSALKHNHVTVSWPDRSGTTQTVELHSSIVGLAPVYSAALALPPQDNTLSLRRHLPVGAKRLGQGRSVFKPSPRSSVAWVINHATGDVVAQCSVPPTLAASDITEADLGPCSDLVARLVRGYIRFSLSAVPDAMSANDAPLTLTLAPASARCETEAVGSASSPERYLAYTCLALPGNPEPLQIIPDGWAFGHTTSTYKACRYSSAQTASPQNYLVIRGDAACPGALPQHNGASVATVQYQP
jgi:Tfp pilus assembly protein PilV